MTATVSATRAIDSIRTLKGAFVQADAQALRDAVKVTEAAAKGTTLWKDQTGGTRASIRSSIVGSGARVIARGAAHYLEHGTRPHAIVAHGAALHFWVNGVEFFRKRVWHPGTAPRPFMEQARDRGAVAYSYAIEYYLSYAIARS